MQIIKPNLSDIPLLIPLWEEQYTYHRNLDDVYYAPFDDALATRIAHHMKQSIETDTPHLLVAKDKDQFVGFITFKIDTDDYFDTLINRFGLVIELYVKQSYRGQRIGQMLMDTAEQDYFKPHNIEHIRVMASRFNPQAHHFYEKLDYHCRQIVFYKKSKSS